MSYFKVVMASAKREEVWINTNWIISIFNRSVLDEDYDGKSAIMLYGQTIPLVVVAESGEKLLEFLNSKGVIN